MQLEAEARAIESFHRHPRVLRLECGIQHYDWGCPEAIPAILGRPNPAGRPFAELWAGAHPDLPSQAIIDGVRVPLDLLLHEAATETLGQTISSRFRGELPFLMKILAADKALSIQAHPNRAQALLGFERENLAGVPRDAATRNYRDQHHKPELLAALGDFYALRGFRPVHEIEQMLASTPELAPLAGHNVRDEAGLAALYGHILHLDRAGASTLLQPLLERLEREEKKSPFSPDDREYWMLRVHHELSNPGRPDQGLLSMLLLNLVHLRRGQAIFLPAGELHAYLQGAGIEIMANSNNVLRGGLTSKHVDPDELLHIVRFGAGSNEVLDPETNAQEPRLAEYRTPASEFSLSRLGLDPGLPYAIEPGEMRLALITKGSVEVREEGQPRLRARAGDALLFPAGRSCRVFAAEGAELWLAGVPAAGPGSRNAA